MISTAQDTERYQERFAKFETAAGSDSAWLRAMRREAMGCFSELGFPTTHDEDWKFTNLEPLVQIPFLLPQDSSVESAPKKIEGFMFPGLQCRLMVFVNGRYSPRLSSPGPSDGVKVASLPHALKTDGDLIEEHLARYADYRRDPFSALNTAFMEDGALVYIPRGRVLEEPIHLLYVSTETASPIVTHPRNLIVAGEESQATIVEHYVSTAEGAYFSNAVTEVVAGGGSVLSHYLIELESKNAFNVSTLRVEQSRSSSVTSHSVLVGGTLVRNNVHPVMAGEGGDCLINGLFMARDKQHMDNYMRVEHVGPHCGSRQFYNGIMDGRSHGVFHGRIVVHKGAQKTDAKQTNRNLLLSEDAQIDTKPQLEIYADDVKCTHGATIGQIDENAIFYLRSRGISEEAARAILLFAFANESLGRMKVETIRKYLEALVAEWMPHRELVEVSG